MGQYKRTESLISMSIFIKLVNLKRILFYFPCHRRQHYPTNDNDVLPTMTTTTSHWRQGYPKTLMLYDRCQHYPTNNNAIPPTASLSHRRRHYPTNEDNAIPPMMTLPHQQQRYYTNCNAIPQTTILSYQRHHYPHGITHPYHILPCCCRWYHVAALTTQHHQDQLPSHEPQ